VDILQYSLANPIGGAEQVRTLRRTLWPAGLRMRKDPVSSDIKGSLNRSNVAFDILDAPSP
jgi:hypothetical protein